MPFAKECAQFRCRSEKYDCCSNNDRYWLTLPINQKSPAFPIQWNGVKIYHVGPVNYKKVENGHSYVYTVHKRENNLSELTK